MNHHRTDTCAFMMNTRMAVNILDHHPILDSVVTYNNPSGFMSLQDIEDINILVDVDFSSNDELPDFNQRTIL